MMVKFDPTTYSKVKNEVKEMFRDEKVGKQQTYESQSELFKPIINSTKEVALDEKQSLNNILALRDNEQRLALRQAIQDMSGLSDVFTEPKESTPKAPRVDLNKGFDQSDFENLQDLSLPFPHEVFSNIDEIPEILKEVKTKIKSLAQEFREDRLTKKSEREKDMYKSQRNTLDKYKTRLKYIRESKSVVGEGKHCRCKKLVKKKCGRGRPKTNYAIVYNDEKDLCQKLEEYIASYHAGNNGVYNTIITILDELLNKKIIGKDTHDQILKTSNL